MSKGETLIESWELYVYIIIEFTDFSLCHIFSVFITCDDSFGQLTSWEVVIATCLAVVICPYQRYDYHRLRLRSGFVSWRQLLSLWRLCSLALLLIARFTERTVTLGLFDPSPFYGACLAFVSLSVRLWSPVCMSPRVCVCVPLSRSLSLGLLPLHVNESLDTFQRENERREWVQSGTVLIRRHKCQQKGVNCC